MLNQHAHIITGTVYDVNDYTHFFEKMAHSSANHHQDQDDTPLPYNEVFLKHIANGYQQWQRVAAAVQLDKTMMQSIKKFNRPVVWLIITEPWCGDANANLPIWLAVAQQCPHITVRVVLRDQNILLIDQYLTNGGRAIPKLVCIDEQTKRDLGTWGPRPQALQNHIPTIRNRYPDFKDYLSVVDQWYADDKNKSLMAEIKSYLELWQNA